MDKKPKVITPLYFYLARYFQSSGVTPRTEFVNEFPDLIFHQFRVPVSI